MLTFNPSPLCGLCGKWLNLNFPHLGWLCNSNSSVALCRFCLGIIWVMTRIRLANPPSMLMTLLHLSFWAWLSQLSNNRCIFNILGFLLSMFLTLICVPTFVCQLTVKFYRALVCSDASHSPDPSILSTSSC